jgi:hypothetical protein
VTKIFSDIEESGFDNFFLMRGGKNFNKLYLRGKIDIVSIQFHDDNIKFCASQYIPVSVRYMRCYYVHKNWTISSFVLTINEFWSFETDI